MSRAWVAARVIEPALARESDGPGTPSRLLVLAKWNQDSEGEIRTSGLESKAKTHIVLRVTDGASVWKGAGMLLSPA